MQMQLSTITLTRWKFRNNFIDSIHNRNVPDRIFVSDNSVVKSTRFLDNKNINPIIKNWWNTEIFLFLISSLKANGFGDQKTPDVLNTPWDTTITRGLHKTLILFPSDCISIWNNVSRISLSIHQRKYLTWGNDGFGFMLKDDVLYWLEYT